VFSTQDRWTRDADRQGGVAECGMSER